MILAFIPAPVNLHARPTAIAFAFMLAATATLARAAATELTYIDEGSPIKHEIRLTKPLKHITQETPGTCWLACAAMIHDFNGDPVSESDLHDAVKKITGSDRDGKLEASKRECVIALARRPGAAENLKERISNITDGGVSIGLNVVEFLSSKIAKAQQQGDLNTLISALSANEPVVIVHSRGQYLDGEHAVVVTKAKLGETADGRPGLVGVEVHDPGHAGGANQPLSSEFLKKHLQAIMTRELAIEWLEKEAAAAKVTKADPSGKQMPRSDGLKWSLTGHGSRGERDSEPKGPRSEKDHQRRTKDENLSRPGGKKAADASKNKDLTLKKDKEPRKKGDRKD